MLEENYRESDFIYAHRRFADPRDPLHLTPEELYLYSTLYTLRMKDDSIVVNVQLIEKMMRVPFDKRSSRNKNMIRTTLIQLIRKGVYIACNYLTFDDSEGLVTPMTKKDHKIVEKIGYDTVFRLILNDEYLKSIMNDNPWRGFVRLPFTEMKLFKDIKKFYIYFSVFAKETTEGTATISYEEWARILQVSYKTAIKHVNECVVNEKDYQKGHEFIYVRRGEFIDDYRKRREINTYSTTPIDSDKEPVIRRIKDKRIKKGVKSDKKNSENPF